MVLFVGVAAFVWLLGSKNPCTPAQKDPDAIVKVAYEHFVRETLRTFAREEVSNAVSRKLAATQELQRKDTEIEIERKERIKRQVRASAVSSAPCTSRTGRSARWSRAGRRPRQCR